MPFPSRYYVPDRIRESWHPRLKTRGLWLEVDEEEPVALKKGSEKEEVKDEFRKAFHHTKVTILLSYKGEAKNIQRYSRKRARHLVS